tara:strand:- start:638 stop:1168 length:531 start_codon:yes stop_codon:yes gene_type:complete
MSISTQKISTTNKTEIALGSGDLDSMVFANTHATAAVTIDLWVTDQSGVNVTNSTVLAAANGKASRLSLTLAVDTVGATDDALLNERIYKSDGSFFGICTLVNSTTLLTFGGGLVKDIPDTTALHVGTRYYLLNNVVIPNGASLKLTADEFNIDPAGYNLYIDASSGDIDIITRKL